MEVEEELQKLLSKVDDPSQRQKALELWGRIKGKLSKKQRLAILRAWNSYLIDANLSLFDQTIQTVIDDLEEQRSADRPRRTSE